MRAAERRRAAVAETVAMVRDTILKTAAEARTLLLNAGLLTNDPRTRRTPKTHAGDGSDEREDGDVQDVEQDERVKKMDEQLRRYASIRWEQDHPFVGRRWPTRSACDGTASRIPGGVVVGWVVQVPHVWRQKRWSVSNHLAVPQKTKTK